MLRKLLERCIRALNILVQTRLLWMFRNDGWEDNSQTCYHTEKGINERGENVGVQRILS